MTARAMVVFRGQVDLNMNSILPSHLLAVWPRARFFHPRAQLPYLKKYNVSS